MPTARPEKIDLFKLHRDEYAAPKKPALVEVGSGMYLAVEGTGAPGGPDFEAKIGALYGIAYTVKMTRKVDGRGDYVVGKLEAQWWTGDGDPDFETAPPDEWCWRLMIRTPEVVKAADLKDAVRRLESKGKGAHAGEVALNKLREGRCVQMLHVGPYDREGETVEVMQRFAEAEGLAFHGLHHEIYLSDPRRVPPERLKTLLRRPVKKR
jgi:hypothetical protein